jgi:hypothetical protein
MSTARAAAIARATDAIRQFFSSTGDKSKYPFTDQEVAEAVIDQVYPKITKAKQLLGVPEGSILVAEYPGELYRPLIWEDGKLHGRVDAMVTDVTPEVIINRRGPLTVVWMP